MDSLSQLTYIQLSKWTDYFSESRCIGHFQGGKFYRVEFDWPRPEYFVDEIILLRHERMLSHLGMVKMYGFCADGEHVGAMYELQASDSVHNLIPKDSFTWLQRIKVALGIASLLKFLHTGSSQYSPILVRNLDAAHILLDENDCPHLCDFGMVTGGIFSDRMVDKNDHVRGCYDYIDLYAGEKGNWTDKQDVFAYGVILLGLITKRIYTEDDRQANSPFVHELARIEYEASQSDSNMKTFRCSLVHESLTNDPDFDSDDGVEITAMAMECINICASERLTMKQVLISLLKLPVVKKHTPFLGVNKLLHQGQNGY